MIEPFTMSLREFLRKHRPKIRERESGEHIGNLRRLHRQRGFSVLRVFDERFGNVDGYDVGLMKEYFAGLAGKGG